MDKKEMFVDILLPLPLPDFFTYQVPEPLENEIEIGKRVFVSFGRQKFYAGIVCRIHHQKPQEYRTKQILSVLDAQPIVNSSQLKFWEWISDYYMCCCGEVMSVALPSAFRLTSETKIRLHPDFTGEISHLSEKELLIVESLSMKKNLTIRQVEKLTKQPKVITLIKNLIDKNIILVCEEVEEKYKAKTESFVGLAAPYKDNIELLSPVFEELEKKKNTQKQVDALLLLLSLLQKENNPYIRKSDFLKQEKVSLSQLEGLIKKKIIEIHTLPISRLPSFSLDAQASFSLTDKQEKTLDSIVEQFQEHETVLLHGVTGSGKTEIYIKLIRQYLAQEKQVLYLLPEIALTTQIIDRLRKYFGDHVGVYHSRFNDSERVEIWNRVLDPSENKYKIVIGARSALFLPFNNLGLIIVDEEHDTSYKQFDPAPRYQARDAAIMLAKMHGAKTLLGSATPSVEAYYNVINKKYGFVSLFERYGGLALPEIHIVDLRKETKNKEGLALYSKTLLSSIEKALEQNEQVILFQNRRGFSLHLECDICNHIPSCKYCDVTLTYHKGENQLRCHYCGYAEAVVNKCPACNNLNMQMRGFGTEKVEEELKIMFPEAKVMRLDYDTTRSKTSFQRIISDFENGKINILVGTQMVTKGLDFDNVSLVGVLNADNMLYYPDFRSLERAFQILSQVSGRAGRKNKQGKVIIQTFNPKHQIFQHVIANDYYSLFEQTMRERETFLYPPICRFIKITLKHKTQNTLDESALQLANALKKTFPNALLGPEYPLVMKVRNYYIKEIIIKIARMQYLSQYKKLINNEINLLKQQPSFRSGFIHLDVDSY